MASRTIKHESVGEQKKEQWSRGRRRVGGGQGGKERPGMKSTSGGCEFLG